MKNLKKKRKLITQNTYSKYLNINNYEEFINIYPFENEKKFKIKILPFIDENRFDFIKNKEYIYFEKHINKNNNIYENCLKNINLECRFCKKNIFKTKEYIIPIYILEGNFKGSFKLLVLSEFLYNKFLKKDINLLLNENYILDLKIEKIENYYDYTFNIIFYNTNFLTKEIILEKSFKLNEINNKLFIPKFYNLTLKLKENLKNNIIHKNNDIITLEKKDDFEIIKKKYI